MPARNADVVSSPREPANTQLLLETEFLGIVDPGHVFASLDVSAFSQIRIAWLCANPSLSVGVYSGQAFIALLKPNDDGSGSPWSTLVLDVPGTTLAFKKASNIGPNPGPMFISVWGR